MRYHDNGVVFTIKPAVTLSDAGGEYLLSNIWNGANYTTYFKVTDAGTDTPTLTRLPRVDLAATYAFPPNPTQPHTSSKYQSTRRWVALPSHRLHVLQKERDEGASSRI